MKRDSIWRKFEKSGSVFDYLEYACTCEEDVRETSKNVSDNSVAGGNTTGVEKTCCAKNKVSAVYRTDL